MNEQIALGRIAIFIIATLPIHEHKNFFHRYEENVPLMKTVKSKGQAGWGTGDSE